MSHLRSNTRSKSNLKPSIEYVTASSTTTSSLRPSTMTSPQTFLPPSHYAAAATPWGEHTRESRLDYNTVLSVQKGRQQTRRPQTETVKPAADVNPLLLRQNTSRSRSRTVSERLEPDDRFNRDETKSRQSYLPNLEALLLPSLRDTVDRMTRPHDKQLQSSLTDSTSHLASDTSNKSRFTEASVPSPSMIPRVLATERPDFSNTTHHSQSVTKKKSSMKSVSRSSTAFSASQDRAGNNEDLSRANYASKQIGSELASNRTYSNSAKTSSIMCPTGRMRSVTDPGSMVASQPVETISQTPMTPQPRPVSRFRQPNTPSRIPKRGIASDSSDIDCDTHYRPRRLIVTNASIVPSSSSESEAEVQPPRYPTNHTAHSRASFSLHNQSRLTVGLGQGSERDYTNPGNSWSMPPSNSDKREQTPRMSPVRNEDRHEAIVAARQPVDTTQDPATSRTTNEIQIQERRRTALLGIFDGIDFTATTRETSMMVTESERSLDQYQESTDLGLAISNSGDANTATENSIQYLDDDDPEDYVARSQNISGPRSDNTTPKPSSRCFLSKRHSHQDLTLPQSLSASKSSMPADPFVQTHTANIGILESRLRNPITRDYTSSAGTITSDTVTLVDDSLSLAARERLALGIPPSASDDLSGGSSSFGLSQADSNLSTMSFDDSQEHDVDLSQGAEALFRKISLHKLQGSSQNRVFNRHNIPLRALSPSVSISSNVSSAPSVYDEDIDDAHDSRTDSRREVQRNSEMPEPSQSSFAVYNASMTSKVEHKDPRNSLRHYPSRPYPVHGHKRSENPAETLDSDQASAISSTTSRRFARQYMTETHNVQHRCSKSILPVLPHHDTVTSTSQNELEGNQCSSLRSLSINDDTKNRPTIIRGGAWASMLSSRELDRILQKYGQQEVERQEVIINFIESEEAFIEKFQVIIRLFIQPLRLSGRKAWIEGIPPDICRLFDWLEDIVNLHAQLLSTLRTIQKEQFPVIRNFCEPLRVFVPRLEVYQPYLARIDAVVDSLSVLLEQNDDFATFVRLQETQNDDCKWSLLDTLSEPLDRLAMLTDYFEKIFNLTNKSHSDYLAAFSLLHSTRTILRVMGEVKFREDDYDILKDIVSRLHGLPDATSLVCRERKLLVQGVLYANDPIPPKQQNSLSIPPLLHTDTRNQRTSKLFTAINEWDLQRQASLKSNASSGISFRTCESSNTLTLGRKSSTPFAMGFRPRRRNVQVFVFIDLVLLTTLDAHEDSASPVTWSLLPEIGLSRLLGIKEETTEAGIGFTLDILPMNATELQHGILSENARVTSIHLCITDAVSHPAESTYPKKEEWLSAFQKCFEFTLCSLSFPSHSGGYLAHGPNVDLEMDTQEYVRTLLGSGLPIPKSPSAQVQDMNADNAKSREKEREERGWWSLRFQQVLREMQRYNHI